VESNWDEELEDDQVVSGPSVEEMGHRPTTVTDWVSSWAWRDSAPEEKSHDSILYDSRFSAGQVFTPELWGVMLGRMFYMPAVIELMEALIMPNRRSQHAFPWQVQVPPKYIGLKFVDLISDMALGCSLDEDDQEGAQTSVPELPALAPTCSKVLSNSSGEVAAQRGPPAVPIALYRLRADFCGMALPAQHGTGFPSSFSYNSVPSFSEKSAPEQQRINAADLAAEAASIVAEGIGGHHFLALAPTPDTILKHGDWLIVFGGKKFGKRMSDRGWLRGSRPSSSGQEQQQDADDLGFDSRHVCSV